MCIFMYIKIYISKISGVHKNYNLQMELFYKCNPVLCSYMLSVVTLGYGGPIHARYGCLHSMDIIPEQHIVNMTAMNVFS